MDTSVIMVLSMEVISMKFYDMQLGRYSYCTTLEGLIEMLLSDYCECGEGYDVLDWKDNKMKCTNCYTLNHLDTLPLSTLKSIVIEYDYLIEEDDNG